ncbi:YrpD family protein [Paenibacillus peoriae]|uniref:YrpD family protein n=1 Tax=Paenibacillus peoriae TaxID=59893 RepID=UPI002116B382|nr:YrpD family protein [Paenibacillus peoriae]
MLSLSLTCSVGAESLQNEQLINPSMTKSDNAFLSDIINSLDPEDRENVTYIDETGKVLVNKESLRQEVIPLEPVSQVTYKNSNSSLTSVTDIRDNNSGYNGSTGFIYMGGWSNTNMAVDVGLQHSTKYNDWAPFMLIEGVKEPYSFKPRFEPDQEVQMKFYVPSDGNIALTVSGYADGEKISRTYVEPAPGWTATGNGNLIKRTTSIGQIQGQQDYNDGSYIRKVRWATSYIGTNSEDNIPWRNSQTYDYCSMPRSKVVVDYVHGGEETDNIFLD